MALLSTADLTMMRDIIGETLPDTCHILAETIASDGEGGVTSNWRGIAINVACRLDQPTSRQFGEIAPVTGSSRQEQQFVLSVPYDTDISVGNRVEKGTSAYTVIAVNTDVSWKAVGRALLKYIEPITANAYVYSLDFSKAENSQYIGAI